MARVFISYSRADAPFIGELVPLLEEVFPDHEMWYDSHIAGGEDWWQRILREIAAADLFIFLMSNDSLESEYCHAELREALRLQKPCLPVIVQPKTDVSRAPDDLEPELSRRNWIDMSGGFRDYQANARLYSAVGQLLNQLPQTQPAPLSEEPVSRPDVAATSPKRSGKWSRNRLTQVIVMIGLVGIFAAVLSAAIPVLTDNEDDLTITSTPAHTPTPEPSATPPMLMTASVGANSGTLPVGGAQVFTYDGHAGERLTLYVLAAAPANTAGPTTIRNEGLLDPLLIVRQPDQAVIAENDDIESGKRTDSLIEDLVLSENGTYQFEVRSHGNRSGGAFRLLVQSSEAMRGGLPDLFISAIDGPQTVCMFTSYVPDSSTEGSYVLASWSDYQPDRPLTQAMNVAVSSFSVEIANGGGNASTSFAVTALAITEADFTEIAGSAPVDVETLLDFYDDMYGSELHAVLSPPLRPGETTVVEVDVAFLGEGNFAVVAMVDFENTLAEQNEDNNLRDYSVFLDPQC